MSDCLKFKAAADNCFEIGITNSVLTNVTWLVKIWGHLGNRRDIFSYKK